jgi:hypothetical protein
MSNFRSTDRQTGFLMPPSVDEWLPQRHLARFVVEVVDGLDLTAMSKSYPLGSVVQNRRCPMKRVGELRQRADRYRRLKRQISDPAALQAIGELAGEIKMTAAELEKWHLIRERAHEIWIERGHPEGSDVENWLTAERELAALDHHTQRRREPSSETSAACVWPSLPTEKG